MRACTLRKISRFFFSTSIVCPNIGMTRSVEKNEFQCQGALLEHAHVMGLVCMHASFLDALASLELVMEGD